MSRDGSTSLQPGTVLGRYQLTRRLGAGGMGEVFEAKHLDLEKVVALKTLHGAIAERSDVRARFLREGQAAARIRHPNAVDVTDVGVADGVPYLVMEMLRGEDLQGLLRRQRVLAPTLIAGIVIPVLSALSAAHAEGIVHRDLKPANIFLHCARDGSLVPKVLDFGISKMSVEEGTALTGTSALMGTPSYISPEQLMSTRDVDARADIYSMGVILYECATGTVPFRGDTPFMVMSAVSAGAFVPPRQVRPDLPEAFELLILRAMSRDPAQRFASAQALSQALLPFADADIARVWSERLSAPPTPPPSSPSLAPPPPSRPSVNTLSGNASNLTTAAISTPPRTRTLAMGLALLGLLALGGVAATLASNHTTTPPGAAPAPTASSPSPPPSTPSATPAPTRTLAAATPPPVVPRAAPPTVAVAPSPVALSPVVVAPPPTAPVATMAPAPPAAGNPPSEGLGSRRRRSHRYRRDEAGTSDLVGLPVIAPSNPSSVGTNAMPVVR